LGLPLLEEGDAGSVRLNAAAREALGVGSATPVSLEAALKPLTGDQAQACAQHIRRARQGEPCELVLEHGLRALFSPAAVLGRVNVVLATARSVEHASLQRRALATDRSAHTSHELANALGAIAGWARLAREGARVDEALDLIEKSAETAWCTARNMLGDVSGQTQNGEAAPTVDLSALAEQATRLLMPKALKKKVSVRSSITPGLCIAGDRGSAWSILWNLAANAVEALSSGGLVTVQLSATGEVVHLCVSDNGPGMAADVRARVFEPYFTTKSDGSGIGLSTVKRAVAELGGRLELDTSPGRGTRFQIDLPRALEAEQPRRRRQASSKRSSGVFLSENLEGRFLVVDDDAALREMVATALQMRGAEVVAVANLNEALAQQGPFKMALVDLMLGDQRGDVVLARLRSAGLVDLALLVTGTELPRRLAQGGAPDGVLRKPFELQELYERVAEVLTSERSDQTVAG
jgi:signal transduction histidine kinase/CheY-like chemotaxis protein